MNERPGKILELILSRGRPLLLPLGRSGNTDRGPKQAHRGGRDERGTELAVPNHLGPCANILLSGGCGADR
jgi:hypothetical protein